MELKELTARQLRQLYETELVNAFPPDERKPLEAMERLMAQGQYRPLGLYDGGQLLGYALLWLAPGCPYALADYLGILAGRRGQGLGGCLLKLLEERFRNWRGIFGEVEAPESGSPGERAIREGRLAFYERGGFRYGGYDCALFGVRYRTLILSRGPIDARELMEAHRTIYREHMPPRIYQKYIQIPLLPGETPRPAHSWQEDGTFDDL